MSRYQALPTFGGVFEPGKLDNSFHLFNAGGTDWLVLALEFTPRHQVLLWANQVVAAHPDRMVIVLTHTYLHCDNTLHGSDPNHGGTSEEYGIANDPEGANDGVEMWDKLVRRHRNISFVFNGHVRCGPDEGTGRLVSIGDKGNLVYQVVANYQGLGNGGDGFLRLMEFDPAAKTVSVKTYSPFLDTFKTDSENQFSFANVR